jgi:hypothetical protein
MIALFCLLMAMAESAPPDTGAAAAMPETQLVGDAFDLGKGTAAYREPCL